jgi:hypothetical protein
MKTCHKKAATYSDVNHSQQGLWERGIFTQENAKTYHESNQGICGPFLKSKDAHPLMGYGLDTGNIAAGKPGEAEPENEKGQEDATDDQDDHLGGFDRKEPGDC